ncbi:hypothetical protein, partial [Desulfococcus sp.]|uniref:hypothetical protein n=1 Tax=Desulfococcus sp. TaxID=2025834 RepID=UPI0035941CAA
MAIFEAEAIRALEFFHQVFGVSSRAPASLREGRVGRPSPIAGGRQNGLFFHTSPRKDSESLYLNLCFLEALSRLVFPRLQSLRPPDLGFSLDAVHITFGHEAARLPFLWAFDIAWIEGAARGMPGRSAVCPDQAPFYGVFFLGTLQCGALMARHHPTADMLDDAVASVVQEISRHGAEPGGADLAALTENLFRSEVAGGGEAWSEPEEALYRRAFQLGVDLVAAGMAGECPPEDQFFPRLAALKADVWGGLFESGPRSEGPLRREEDTAIHAVLTGLMARWRRASGPLEYPRPGADGSAAGGG